MTGKCTIKVIVFSSKKEEFTDYWEDKFLARASCHGFQELLTGCKLEEVPRDSTILDATQSDKKEKIRNKDLNKEAYEELILSIDTSTAAGKVEFCSEKLHLQSYLEMLWFETGYFGLLGTFIFCLLSYYILSKDKGL